MQCVVEVGVKALPPLVKGGKSRQEAVRAGCKPACKAQGALLASKARPADCYRTLFDQLYRHPGHCQAKVNPLPYPAQINDYPLVIPHR